MDVEVELHGDERGKFFSQLPQPPEQAPEEKARGKLTQKVNDEYMTNLERYEPLFL